MTTALVLLDPSGFIEKIKSQKGKVNFTMKLTMEKDPKDSTYHLVIDEEVDPKLRLIPKLTHFQYIFSSVSRDVLFRMSQDLHQLHYKTRKVFYVNKVAIYEMWTF